MKENILKRLNGLVRLANLYDEIKETYYLVPDSMAQELLYRMSGHSKND